MIETLLTRSEELLRTAIDAVDHRVDGLSVAVEDLPTPVYITDQDGVIVYYNKACIEFAGRKPAVGKDRWCVSWKLFTEDGEFIPHDQCPMAHALRNRLPVRGVVAVAKRPDGARVTFAPLPTPLFDKDGVMIGAINMLVDVTELRQIEDLRAQADRCRRMAHSIHDQGAIDSLCAMAVECDQKAALLEAQVLGARTLN